MMRKQKHTRQVTDETIENIGLMEEAETLVGVNYPKEEITEKLIRIAYQILRYTLMAETANIMIDELTDELKEYRKEIESAKDNKQHDKRTATNSKSMSVSEL